MEEEAPKETKDSYAKKPLWQWIVIYLIIGGLIYGLIYYFVIAKKGNNPYTSTQTTPSENTQNVITTGSPTSIPESVMVENSLVTTRTDPAKGNYMTDPKGMTLYIFDNDSPNKSTCSGTCLATWPIYEAPSANPSNLPENFGVTQATNGSYMYTYKGMPLYYYSPDKVPGDIKGDGVGGVWHLVKP